jgi:hypothetical protein
VVWIAAEFEYVPLREAHVFQNLPGRVRQSFDLPVAQIWRKAVSQIVE